MAIQRIIGVDFGTSTSAVRIKRYNDGKPIGERMSTQAVTFDMGNSLVPTLIRKVGETSFLGFDARNPKRNSVLYQNFKMDLESPNPERRKLARSLAEEFMKYLCDSYRAQSDGGHFGDLGDQERTYISYPVKWKSETKQFMLDAARKAGFPDVVGMDEAQAAVLAATLMNVASLVNNGYLKKNRPSNILLLDMGAGTSDLVMCRCTPGDRIDTQTLCTWPKEGTIKFGGREVDELLSSYIHSKLPAVAADEVLQRIGLEQFKAWKENLVSPVLKDNQTVNEFSVLDQIVDLTGINILPYSSSWSLQ